MQQKTKIISFAVLLAFSCFLIACSGSSVNDDYVMKHNKKPKEGYSSIAGIEKKSLIDESSLETLTDIVSEYANSSEERDRVMTKIIELINTPYLWGGMSTNGIDCSAFVQRVYKQALNIDIPRTSIVQSTIGTEVKREDLKFGDLVFFNTMGNRISHVGIYVGENSFAQSSSNGGVKVSSLLDDYYNARYVTARRILP